MSRAGTVGCLSYVRGTLEFVSQVITCTFLKGQLLLSLTGGDSQVIKWARFVFCCSRHHHSFLSFPILQP